MLAALAVPFVALGTVQAWRDAPTWDEGIYLASGLSTLVHREIAFNYEHPPLAKVVAAAPALAAGPQVPITDAWREHDQFAYTADFLDAQGGVGEIRRLTFLSRLLPLLGGVLVAVVLYALGTRLLSRGAGVVAAGLWLTMPFVLGLAHLNSLDTAFTLVTVTAAWGLVRHLEDPGWRSTAVLGAVCAAALLTRHTGLVLVPAVVLAMVLGGWRRSPRRTFGHAALVLAVAWVAVWGVYRAAVPDPGDVPGHDEVLMLVLDTPEEPTLPARLVTALPWPAEYETGLDYLSRVSAPPAPAFLFGESWTGRRWWYWPGSMLVKLLPTTLLFLVAGLWGWRHIETGRRRVAALALGVPALALTAFTVTQPRQIGLRYLLPVLALWLVGAGAVTTVGRDRLVAGATGAVVGLQLVALLASHPHTLAWTVPPFRPAYRWVSDANLDWNQDFWRLRDWAEDHADEPWVAVVPAPGLGVHLVPGGRQLLGEDPSQVSAGDHVAAFGSILTTYKRDELSWLRAYCPVGDIGGSIVLYRFEEPPDLSPGPDQPAAPCPDGPSVRVVGPVS